MPLEAVDLAYQKQGVVWEDLKDVYVDEASNLRIAQIHTEADCTTFGNVMGHCAGHHKALVQYGCWKFFAVFDEKHRPHNSIHCRWASPPDEADFRAWQMKHPTLGFYYHYDFHGYDFNEGWSLLKVPIEDDKDAVDPEPPKYTDAWYTWRSRLGARKMGQIPFMFEGVPHVIISANVRGQYDKVDRSSDLTKAWYEANKIADAKPVRFEREPR